MHPEDLQRRFDQWEERTQAGSRRADAASQLNRNTRRFLEGGESSRPSLTTPANLDYSLRSMSRERSDRSQISAPFPKPVSPIKASWES